MPSQNISREREKRITSLQSYNISSISFSLSLTRREGEKSDVKNTDMNTQIDLWH